MPAKFTVKMGLEGLPPAQVVERGRMHAAAIAANPLVFPTPTPTMVALLAKCDEVEAADIAVTQNGGKLDHLNRNARVKELRSLIKDLAGYVQAISDGDPEVIALSAFATRKFPEPSALPDAAGDVRVRMTTKPGELRVRWNGVRNRSIYILQICSGDPLQEESWKLLVMTGKTFHDATALGSHQPYYFRVAVVGAAGVSAYSDIARGTPL